MDVHELCLHGFCLIFYFIRWHSPWWLQPVSAVTGHYKVMVIEGMGVSPGSEVP